MAIMVLLLKSFSKIEEIGVNYKIIIMTGPKLSSFGEDYQPTPKTIDQSTPRNVSKGCASASPTTDN